ncbi:response regulator [Candidatus Pacearchaeota archaeon]|nr:response regulator [Candidatus Pacearchaeota archaeon]
MSEQKIVMVVDDEEDIRRTMKLLLEKNKYKVILCVDADDALKKLKKEKPDLILLDIMMPGTPVREMISKISKDVKISFLSVVRMSDAEKEGLKISKNIVDYIQKPFDNSDLLKRVNKILEKK